MHEHRQRNEQRSFSADDGAFIFVSFAELDLFFANLQCLLHDALMVGQGHAHGCGRSRRAAAGWAEAKERPEVDGLSVAETRGMSDE